MRCLAVLVTVLYACAQPSEGVVASTLEIEPNPALPPSFTPFAINVGPGDQYDVHVDEFGELVSYTSDLLVRYYRFSNGVDDVVPTAPFLPFGARALLASVSDGKIAFSWVFTGLQTSIHVFDVAAGTIAEIDLAAGVTRIGVAIAGTTVAYVDYTHAPFSEPHGEMFLHQAVPTQSIRLTNDTALDANPMFAAGGGTLVWEHCATSSSNCDILQAVATPVFQNNHITWPVSIAVETDRPEMNPDTNGEVVVYETIRGSNNDICWTPVAGGDERCLALASYEHRPRIAGNLVLFERRMTLFDTTDLYVYDMFTNFLYQITATPAITEQLADIALRKDGVIHIAWTTDEDGFDQRNVHGAELTVPASTLLTLIPTVVGLGLNPRVEDQLVRFLERALTSVQDDNPRQACRQIDAFINHVEAKTPMFIDRATADMLLASAAQIRTGLGCQ